MTFHVGQKVVCVDDSDTSADNTREIANGAIYIVRWQGQWRAPTFRQMYCLRLEGIRGVQDEWCSHPCFFDIPFIASRFRPIVETKTDISIFTEMLNRIHQKERA